MLQFRDYLMEARFKRLGKVSDGWRFGVIWGFEDQQGAGFDTVKTSTQKQLKRIGAKLERASSRARDQDFTIAASSESEAIKKIKRVLGSALGL